MSCAWYWPLQKKDKSCLDSPFTYCNIAISWCCQTVWPCASLRQTTTRFIVAVEPRCREGSPLQAICQRKHFSRCSILHICYQLQMFFGCIRTSHLQPFLHSTGHPPFLIQMCCTISETEMEKSCNSPRPFPSCDGLNPWIICLNFGELGYKPQ